MRRKSIILIVMTLGLVLQGCNGIFGGGGDTRTSTVTLFYGAGFNNLSSDISANVQTISEGFLPSKGSPHKLLTYTHLSLSDANFTTPVEGHLVQHWRDMAGFRHADTLLTIDASRTAADPEVMREVLEFIAAEFPDSHYGMIVSSHGTGWLPAGVYGSSSYRPVQYSDSHRSGTEDLPFYNYNSDPDSPKVKTFIAEVLVRDGIRYSQEMSIQSMAASITVPLDYLVFDACLMGCVEVAYQFRGKVGKIGFSPAEVLTTGFDFSDLSMLVCDTPSPEAFCEAYFRMYDSQTGVRRSATITVVEPERMQELATVCRRLFAKYRDSLSKLSEADGIQGYYRFSYHWFFDLEDALVKAGISADEKRELDSALDACISYKAATPGFLAGSGGFEISTYCGLSMYLPSMGNTVLDNFYRTLAWNEASNLVE